MRQHPILLLSFALLFGCAKDPISPAPARVFSDPGLTASVQRAAGEVARIRQLSFKRPVSAAFITQAAYREMAEEGVKNALPPATEKGLFAEYLQLGLVSPRDTALREMLGEYYGSFPAAYYVKGTDSLYVISPMIDDPLYLDEILAHELLHALQDQNLSLDIQDPLPYSTHGSDAHLARLSLVEGDATWNEIAYMFSRYDGQRNPVSAVASFAGERKEEFLRYDLPDTPVTFLSIQGYAPYLLGMSFIAGKLPTLDWTPVNALYTAAQAPRSMTEIALGERIDPVYFEFRPVHERLLATRPEISFFDDDNLGLLMLMAIFAPAPSYLEMSRALGWRGDRYSFAIGPDERYGTLVAAFVFDNGESARGVFRHLDRTIRQRDFGISRPYYTGIDSTADSAGTVRYVYQSPLFTTYLVQSGHEVFWVENAGDAAQELLSLLDRDSSLAKSSAGPLAAMPGGISGEQKHRAVESIVGKRLGSGSR